MDVVENPGQNRFELTLDGGTALVAYRHDGERLVLVHTEVPSQFAGQGVGSRLAKGVFELLRHFGVDQHKPLAVAAIGDERSAAVER